MGTDQAGDWRVAGAAIGQVKLKPRRASSMVREAWDRLLDLAVETWFWVLDRLAPLPETPVDRAIREEGERLRPPRTLSLPSAHPSPRHKRQIPPISGGSIRRTPIRV
jgi:hypothetical protein